MKTGVRNNIKIKGNRLACTPIGAAEFVRNRHEALANRDTGAALRLPELPNGLNTYGGQLVCRPVPDALSLPFTEVSR